MKDDSDYEVPYVDHIVGPTPSKGLVAPGPPASAPPPPPQLSVRETYEVKDTLLGPTVSTAAQPVPPGRWDATMRDPVDPNCISFRFTDMQYLY